MIRGERQAAARLAVTAQVTAEMLADLGNALAAALRQVEDLEGELRSTRADRAEWAGRAVFVADVCQEAASANAKDARRILRSTLERLDWHDGNEDEDY